MASFFEPAPAPEVVPAPRSRGRVTPEPSASHAAREIRSHRARTFLGGMFSGYRGSHRQPAYVGRHRREPVKHPLFDAT